MTSQLFAWDVDRSRRFTRIDLPPLDDNGNALLLVNGAKIPNGAVINLVKTRAGAVGDFLYTVALLLVVSDKVHQILQQLDVTGVENHPAALRDKEGELIKQMSWLNLTKSVALLNRKRSVYTPSVTGHLFERISVFRVMPDAIPPEDLFLCDEGGIPVFSERAVKALRLAGVTGAVFTPLDGMAWP